MGSCFHIYSLTWDPKFTPLWNRTFLPLLKARSFPSTPLFHFPHGSHFAPGDYHHQIQTSDPHPPSPGQIGPHSQPFHKYSWCCPHLCGALILGNAKWTNCWFCWDSGCQEKFLKTPSPSVMSLFTCCYLDEPRKHYAKWEEPDTKGYICCIILLIWNMQNGQRRQDRKISGCLEAVGAGRIEWPLMGPGSPQKVITMFWN